MLGKVMKLEPEKSIKWTNRYKRWNWQDLVIDECRDSGGQQTKNSGQTMCNLKLQFFEENIKA